MTTALITALTWTAFLAIFFYRNMRDRHLNYLAGRSFRAWIAARMSAILKDPDGPLWRSALPISCCPSFTTGPASEVSPGTQPLGRTQ